MDRNKETILIISHFSGGEDIESGVKNLVKDNDRFKYIANKLGIGYSVKVLTSAFFHTQKKHTSKQSEKLGNYELIYIQEPGYKKNICLKRFYSHYIYGRNIRRYLEALEKMPAIIYCAVPSLSGAFSAVRYAKNKDIPIIIDIQDIWPDAFKLVFNPPIVGSLIYYPIKKMADYIYRNATEIVAVSETYCKRAAAVRTLESPGSAIYLGTSFDAFDSISPLSEAKQENEIRLMYIGTLGHSYDLKCAMDAYRVAIEKLSRAAQLTFWVLGDGPLLNEFQQYARDRKLNIVFKGRLNYQDMVAYLKDADIAINPIAGTSMASIINKHGDYAAAGLPVVSTQDSEEYKRLLNDFEAGFTCKSGDAEAVAEKICFLVENSEIRKAMSANSRKMGEALFNRDKTYNKIEEIIEAVKKGRTDREGQL
ncbi:glycosyltransferase family 4 protein [Aminipila butyrica]|uniref:Glycosyltransferase family 4 protein n=1 Tax=Aminipila butyrica TaxID=433296 RepID=A0A858BT82_9FIRM|nr:glycosyltransferase [Aminipila butyrica]QIB68150.1 glycosyltransferase family 4 protein [Aminipila butyrica]